MTTSTSLIDLIMSLLKDPASRAAFQDDPEGFLASCGDISPEDVKDAIDLADDRDSHSGGNHIHVPPAPHPQPHPGESDHEAAVRYLNTYVTNNYTIDDRDIDNSIHQNIDNEGGTFNQDISNVSNSGDGAVVAGDDIDDSTITTGDGNQVGDNNVRADGDGNVIGDGNAAVTGDDNNTSFGSGDVVGGGISVDDGGAYSGHGNATADNDTTVTTTENTTVNDNDVTSTVEDSYNPETSYDTDTTADSNNHTDVNSHNTVDYHA